MNDSRREELSKKFKEKLISTRSTPHFTKEWEKFEEFLVELRLPNVFSRRETFFF